MILAFRELIFAAILNGVVSRCLHIQNWDQQIFGNAGQSSSSRSTSPNPRWLSPPRKILRVTMTGWFFPY